MTSAASGGERATFPDSASATATPAAPSPIAASDDEDNGVSAVATISARFSPLSKTDSRFRGTTGDVVDAGAWRGGAVCWGGVFRGMRDMALAGVCTFLVVILGPRLMDGADMATVGSIRVGVD